MFTSFALKSTVKKRGNNFCTFTTEGHGLGSTVVAPAPKGAPQASSGLDERPVPERGLSCAYAALCPKQTNNYRLTRLI